MSTFLVKSAWKAYKENRFKEALTLFSEAAEILGIDNFKANIILLQKKLGIHIDNHQLKKITIPYNHETSKSQDASILINRSVQSTHELPSMVSQCRNIIQEKPEYFEEWLKKLRIAAIMDEFTWQSYSPEADMLQLTPENWHNELETFNPNMLFVESAWRGKDELWTNIVHKNPPAPTALVALRGGSPAYGDAVAGTQCQPLCFAVATGRRVVGEDCRLPIGNPPDYLS